MRGAELADVEVSWSVEAEHNEHHTTLIEDKREILEDFKPSQSTKFMYFFDDFLIFIMG